MKKLLDGRSHTKLFILKESLKEELGNYFKPYNITNNLSELYIMSLIRVTHRDIVSSIISDEIQIRND